MRAICPHCLVDNKLATVDDPEQGKVLQCGNLQCQFRTVPLLYGVEYADYPPCPVSIVGLSGHGKTVYVEGLLHEIGELGSRWPNSDVYFTWLDEAQMRASVKRIRALRQGKLPKLTNPIFQQPQVLRLSRLPRIGGTQLILFDTGGEAFLDAATLADAGRYVVKSPAVVWLLSLKQDEEQGGPEFVNQMMTVYLQTMARMGGRTRDQTLILVLTKGDELLARPDLPTSARQALEAPNYSPDGPIWGLLERASQDLEKWLRSPDCGYANLVNLVQGTFKAVRYCIVSAQGAPADGTDLEFAIMPRGVLAPLLWLWRLERKLLWVERNGSREMYLSLSIAIHEAAETGGVVYLEEGNYRLSSPLQIRNPVEIVGCGERKTIIEVVGQNYGVKCATSGQVVFRSLTVRRVGPEWGDVIRVSSGELILDDVIISGGLTPGPGVRTAIGFGVVVCRHSRLTANRSTFIKNQRSGALVAEHSALVLTECRFEENIRSGLFIQTDGVFTVTRTVVRKNGTGILVDGLGKGLIEETSCEANTEAGIVIARMVGPEVIVRKSPCHGNGKDGIQIKGEAAPTLDSNICSDNTKSGIAFLDQSAATGTRNTCSNNGEYGIFVADAAAPTLEETTVERNTVCGVFLTGAAGGVFRKTTARKNSEDGFHFASDGPARLEDTTSEGNGGYGVAITNPACPVEFDRKKSALSANTKGPVLDERPRKGWFGS